MARNSGCTIPSMGRAVFSTQPIEKDSIIVDYCGKQIRGVSWKEYINTNPDSQEFLFQVGLKFLIDASAKPCPNHPNIRCLGRLLNHKNSKTQNVTPKLQNFKWNLQALFLVAARDIEPYEQLMFDYKDEVANKLFNDWLINFYCEHKHFFIFYFY